MTLAPRVVKDVMSRSSKGSMARFSASIIAALSLKKQYGEVKREHHGGVEP
jgi:hypothetical protein